jgi:hypothetical protein
MLQRSAKEAGLDHNLRTLQDITRPRLFPDYEWHSDGHIRRHVSFVNDETEEMSMAMSSTKSNPNKPPTTTSTTAATIAARASSVYLINKSREIHQRFQSSSYYVLPTLEADVVRYSHQQQQLKQSSSSKTYRNHDHPQRQQHSFEDANCMYVIEQMGRAANPKYVPPELLKVSDGITLHDFGSSDEGLSSNKRSLDALAAAERAEDGRTRHRSLLLSSLSSKEEPSMIAGDTLVGGAAGGATGVDTGDAGDDGYPSDLQEAEEEEEEDADYATNYYASEDESDGGADEAVF